jgi:hypothetical protein
LSRHGGIELRCFGPSIFEYCSPDLAITRVLQRLELPGGGGRRATVLANWRAADRRSVFETMFSTEPEVEMMDLPGKYLLAKTLPGGVIVAMDNCLIPIRRGGPTYPSQ